MYADSLEELHEFAQKIGLKREWFQDRPRLPHYDLTVTRRRVAVRVGAIEESRRELMARLWMQRRPDAQK